MEEEKQSSERAMAVNAECESKSESRQRVDRRIYVVERWRSAMKEGHRCSA
jgi:hypothetical protein